MNTMIKYYLYLYINYSQDNQIDQLAFAKFARYNLVSVTTKTSLFFANYSFYLQLSFELVLLSNKASTQDAKKFVIQMQEINEFLYFEKLATQLYYKD